MNKNKRFKVAAITATLLVSTVLLAGCNSKTPNASSSKTTSTPTASTVQTAKPNPTASPGSKENPLVPTLFLDLTIPGYKLGTVISKPAGTKVLIVIHSPVPGSMSLKGNSSYAVKLTSQLYGGLTVDLVKGSNPDVVFTTDTGKTYLVAKLTGL